MREQRRRSGRLIPVVILLLAGCHSPVEPDSNAPFVLQMSLRTDTAVQVAHLSILANGLPATGHLVVLHLAGPDGSTALIGGEDSGTWSTARMIVPGGHYRLQGTIDGYLVSGETTVPAHLTIVRHVDTIDMRGKTSGEVPYRWQAGGAAMYWLDLLGPGPHPEPAGLRLRTPDTVGAYPVYSLYGNGPPSDTMLRMLVSAVDRNLVAWRNRHEGAEVPFSTLAGVYGFLGASVSDTLRLVVRR